MRVLSVFGTRPEAVKMAPIVRQLRQTPAVESFVCVTAQHRQMLDQVLDIYDIKPDIDLDLMRENQSLAELSAAIFSHLDPVLEQLDPDWVLVQGDTTTVAITALLAYYRKIRVGHVEAGLRTNDKWQPFPEEINRRVAGAVADLHFAPTEWARQNLLREGIPDDTILVTGNPVIDALQAAVASPEPSEVTRLLERIGVTDTGRRLILVTAHRRENFGRPLEEICLALNELASRGDVEIVYPVHLNPHVQEPVRRLLGDVPHVTLLSPLDYLPWVHMMKHAYIVLTDSGGIQEEAPAFGVPVLVLREVTERPEGIEAGVARLVGADQAQILLEANRLLDDRDAYRAMAQVANPFGDGHSAERIVRGLIDFANR
ncbi:MAG: UDP-N-acetylglucosamine 2-epimerase (non-hydrolyzing) [Chloroflexota bacterium]